MIFSSQYRAVAKSIGATAYTKPNLHMTCSAPPPTACFHLQAPPTAWLVGRAVHGDASSLLTQSVNVLPVAIKVKRVDPTT